MSTCLLSTYPNHFSYHQMFVPYRSVFSRFKSPRRCNRSSMLKWISNFNPFLASYFLKKLINSLVLKHANICQSKIPISLDVCFFQQDLPFTSVISQLAILDFRKQIGNWGSPWPTRTRWVPGARHGVQCLGIISRPIGCWSYSNIGTKNRKIL